MNRIRPEKPGPESTDRSVTADVLVRQEPSMIASRTDEFVITAEIKVPDLRMTLANVHTPTMTLKNAALLALIGTILMTVLLVWDFVFTFLNVLRGVEAPVLFFSSFIYAFGCFAVMVFFYVFHRAQ